MRIALLFASSDAQLGPFFGAKQLAAIPKEIHASVEARGGRIVYVSHLDLTEDVNTKAVEKIQQASDFADSIIIICCESVSDKMSEFRDATFVYDCDLSTLKQNYVNNVRGILSKSIKKFIYFKRNFDDLKYRKILLLPLENFRAIELDEIRGLLTYPAHAHGFFTDLQASVEALRTRKRPKRSNSYPTRFLIDDLGHHYEYGHERHGGPETACPPHAPTCELNGDFRFGSKYERERHFNVSIDGGLISENFRNCHGLAEHHGPKTHINLFPNGSI